MECVNRKDELDNCVFVKTILMLLVIFYHSILYWNGGWFVDIPICSAPVLGGIARWLNSFHIYAFTLVSGYLYSYLRYEKRKYGNFVPFIANKAKRLIVPYAFVAIAWVIPIAIYFFDYKITDIIEKFILASSPNQLWFLWMLFMVFLFSWPLSTFFEKHNILGLGLVLGLYLLGLIWGNFLPNYFMIGSACLYMPLFWIGIKLRQYELAFLKKIPLIIWLLLDILLFLFVENIATRASLVYRLISIACSFLLHIVGSIMAFMGLQKIAMLCPKWKESRFFKMLSSYAMPMYLFHQQIIYFTISWLNGWINPYLHASINFVAAIAISMLLSAVLMKFKATRFLIGEK